MRFVIRQILYINHLINNIFHLCFYLLNIFLFLLCRSTLPSIAIVRMFFVKFVNWFSGMVIVVFTSKIRFELLLWVSKSVIFDWISFVANFVIECFSFVIKQEVVHITEATTIKKPCRMFSMPVAVRP